LEFERLFGDGGATEQRKARMQQTGSILDSVTRAEAACAERPPHRNFMGPGCGADTQDAAARAACRRKHWATAPVESSPTILPFKLLVQVQ
jgi:hypothetical protein